MCYNDNGSITDERLTVGHTTFGNMTGKQKVYQNGFTFYTGA